MKNFVMFQKQVALHETIYCFQALGGLSSFLKLYMYIQIKLLCTQSCFTKISNWDAIANRKTEIQVQAMFPAKKHPDCRHRWPEIQLRYRQLNAKEKPYEQKQREASWDFVYTPSIEHLFTQTSFYCGFDRYKVMDCFQVQLVNWRLLLFQWYKMPFKHFY